MNLPSQDIVSMLEGESSASLDLTFKTNLFVGLEPTTPDNCVTVYDTPGFSPDNTLTKGEEAWRPAVQIKVRNRSYVAAGNLINEIKELLHLQTGETWGGTLYLLIQCDQEPFCLGFDDSNRAMWVCNFSLLRQ